MSFFGNVLDFENFKLGNMWDKIQKNPEQLLLGAGDPFSAKVWGGITGKDYSPLVDQFGGATGDDYQKAEAAGIDTGAGRTMHGAAKAIAGLFAGGYGADQAGGLMSQGGAGMSDSALAKLGYAGPESMSSPGLLSQMGSAAGTASKYAPLASTAMNAAEKGGLLGGQQAPMQPGQLPQFQQIAGTDGGLAELQQKRMKRQQGLLQMGGGNGFA